MNMRNQWCNQCGAHFNPQGLCPECPDPEDEPVQIVVDGLVLLECVDHAEAFEGTDPPGGFFVLEDGRQFRFSIEPIEMSIEDDGQPDEQQEWADFDPAC